MSKLKFSLFPANKLQNPSYEKDFLNPIEVQNKWLKSISCMLLIIIAILTIAILIPEPEQPDPQSIAWKALKSLIEERPDEKIINKTFLEEYKRKKISFPAYQLKANSKTMNEHVYMMALKNTDSTNKNQIDWFEVEVNEVREENGISYKLKALNQVTP